MADNWLLQTGKLKVPLYIYIYTMSFVVLRDRPFWKLLSSSFCLVWWRNFVGVMIRLKKYLKMWCDVYFFYKYLCIGLYEYTKKRELSRNK